MTLTDVPTDNPVDLSDPTTVKRAIAGEQPEITAPENPIVELPRGIFHEGAWHAKCELHELTGEDEERFTRFKDQELFVNILIGGTSRIGSIDLDAMPHGEQEEVIQSLLVGEQMILFVNIVRVTFGNEREFNWRCLSCSSKNITTLVISEDFPVTVPEGITEPHEFVDSKGHTISFIPLSGVHLAEIKQNMSTGAVNTKLLERLITEIDGEVPFSTQLFAKAMGMKDRRDLLAAIDAAQPEIDMDLSIACPVCGEEQTSALSWGDLFRF